ncbi:MAG: hypothetical protein AAFY31_01480 [Pseudomonadota bacterium]
MNPTLLTFATLFAVSFGIVAVGADQREVCVQRPLDTAGQNIGFELIDILRREAWVTTDWTVDAYAKFSPGIAAPNWLKNDPRQGFAARMVFLRSPGCAVDGEYTFQTMFGRTFVHVADLTSLGGDGLTKGALTEATVSKHHRLEFDVGQSVSFLVSPSGERFVRVNQPIDASHGKQALPEGWSLADIRVGNPWRADLIGKVRVLRLGDGTSYQGPIGALPAVSRQSSASPSGDTQWLE